MLAPGVVTKKVLKNLELIIVESDNKSVELLDQNPLVSFVDKLHTIKAPQKRFALPFVGGRGRLF